MATEHEGGGGLLHNPLNVGGQVFDRHAFVRDPEAGVRRPRMKERAEWVETSVPELSIVDKGTWQRVPDRLAAFPKLAPERHRRPKRLFSGLIECGQCGERMTIAYSDRYG